ncbi:MAG: EFR1 family ferrodoxin, partial [Eubacteriales bacterium]|nr:EFR1 family ferrodoxin [Eubacteriales bacterium]
MEKRIYYFSGTGNSYRAAKRIAEALGDTRLISMASDPKDVSAKNSEVIGFVCPIYHWSVCAPIQAFLKALEVNPNAYIFAVTTPVAINGYAFSTIDRILKEKGARLHYGRILYSVANLCIVYTPFPKAKRKVPKMEQKLNGICQEIAAKKERAYPKAALITKLLYPAVMPKYLPLQPVVDLGFTVSSKCVSCGICAKVCPQHNIKLVDGKPTFLHNCCSCMACVSWCPQQAYGYELPPELIRQAGGGLFLKMMGLP